MLIVIGNGNLNPALHDNVAESIAMPNIFTGYMP